MFHHQHTRTQEQPIRTQQTRSLPKPAAKQQWQPTQREGRPKITQEKLAARRAAIEQQNQKFRQQLQELQKESEKLTKKSERVGKQLSLNTLTQEDEISVDQELDKLMEELNAEEKGKTTQTKTAVKAQEKTAMDFNSLAAEEGVKPARVTEVVKNDPEKQLQKGAISR